MPVIRLYTRPRSLAFQVIFSLSIRICVRADSRLTPSVRKVTIRLGITRLGAKAKICTMYTSENTPVTAVENRLSTMVEHRESM